MLYHYWTIQVLAGALVALALTELWLEGQASYLGVDEKPLAATDALPEIPEYLRNIPAERVVRSGR